MKKIWLLVVGLTLTLGLMGVNEVAADELPANAGVINGDVSSLVPVVSPEPVMVEEGAEIPLTPATRAGSYTIQVDGTAKYTDAYQVLQLMNTERKAKGLQPLKMDPTLQEMAMKRAAETNFDFSHSRPDGSSCFTIEEEYGNVIGVWGENIAAGQWSAQEVFTGWKNSPGHYSNMMGNYKSVGIGSFTQGGAIFWVQLFSFDDTVNTKTTGARSVSHTLKIPQSARYGFFGYATDSYHQIQLKKSDQYISGFLNNGWGYVYCVVSHKSVNYATGDANIATVDANGRVTARNKGKTTLNASIKNSGHWNARLLLEVTVPRPTLEYRSYVQNNGWLNYANADIGQTSGSVGRALRLEALQLRLSNNPLGGNIEFRSHVQRLGWEPNFFKSGQTSGSTTQKKRVEAVQIRLTGEVSKYFDVYYRLHVQSKGWLGWAKNGESAGTEGYAYRVEAYEVKLVEKGTAAPNSQGKPAFDKKVKKLEVQYRTHIQSVGWQGYKSNGQMSGTSGRALRLEGINIRLANLPSGVTGGVQYRTHIQKIGWEKQWKANDQMSGTSGRALRLEAIQLKLTGVMAQKYDVYYRVHVEKLGWLDWAKNGQAAGTAGFAFRLEGIEIRLVAKNGGAPGKTTTPYRDGAKRYVDKNGKGLIKGSKSKIYHIPGSQYYAKTTSPARWFKTEAEAYRAGYRLPK